MAELRIENLTKAFGSTEVISDLNLDVGDKELVCVLGPSGCGKSTLLRVVAGLEREFSGIIEIDKLVINDVPSAQRDIAMVFQSYALYPHMTVRRNMAFGLRMQGLSKDVADARVGEAARQLRIENLLERRPRQLSGGQRQRVAIGRAIVREPKLFLLDEPLSNLDAALRGTMRVEIAKLQRSLGATMLYVTHDQVEAMTLADRLALLDGGRLQQYATPLELFYRPANLFVAEFIGFPKINTLPVHVTDSRDAVLTVRGDSLQQPVEVELERPVAVPSDGRLTLAVRADQLAIGKSGSSPFRGAVSLVERLGSECLIHMELPANKPIICKMPGVSQVKTGDVLELVIKRRACFLFSHNGGALPHKMPEDAEQALK